MTSRSPGSSRPGRSPNAWWPISPDERRLTSRRTWSRGTPRASGGSWASRSAGRVKSMTTGLPPGRHEVSGAVPAARQPLRDEPDERGDDGLWPWPVRYVLPGEGLLVQVGAQVAGVGPPHADRELLGGQHVRRLLQGGLGGAVAAPARVGL